MIFCGIVSDCGFLFATFANHLGASFFRRLCAVCVWNQKEVLPVHWYHPFLPIRYHKKTGFARWKIVQIKQKVIVQNTESHIRRTKTVDRLIQNVIC